MSTRDASNRSSLVAFPSVSSSLHSLPQATSIQNVALHPNMYAQRAAESEALLQKALSKTASSFAQHPPASPYSYAPPAQSNSNSSPLMMRTVSLQCSSTKPPLKLYLEKIMNVSSVHVSFSFLSFGTLEMPTG
ncbi:hypothetical protein FPV67DRAFT_1497297 [Lyophyllum atratum]|nr:hypothetical protein FPV67DRAFT_1497297 [Lyophyllum atratum]